MLRRPSSLNLWFLSFARMGIDPDNVEAKLGFQSSCGEAKNAVSIINRLEAKGLGAIGLLVRLVIKGTFTVWRLVGLARTLQIGVEQLLFSACCMHYDYGSIQQTLAASLQGCARQHPPRPLPTHFISTYLGSLILSVTRLQPEYPCLRNWFR